VVHLRYAEQSTLLGELLKVDRQVKLTVGCNKFHTLVTIIMLQRVKEKIYRVVHVKWSQLQFCW